ncbi:MAG: hypothetical protein ACODAF_10075 [Actinomycetota bacterium]
MTDAQAEPAAKKTARGNGKEKPTARRVKGRSGRAIGLGARVGDRTVARRVKAGQWTPVNGEAKASVERGNKMLAKMRRAGE